MRDAFAELLYDETIDNKEFELISIRDFGELVKSQAFNLDEKHVQAISVMLSDHYIGDAFDFKFLEEIFKHFGLA